MKQKIDKYWYYVLIGGIVLAQIVVFAFFGENSYIAVHDNLDLFVTELQMMKNTGTFFSHNVDLPMLGGISRDTFGSEFSLYNIIYFIFPTFVAYMIGYALKIAIGFFSFQLLAKDVYKQSYEKYRPLLWVLGLGYGLIPVFPAYGIAFTSVPIIVYLLKRIYEKPNIWLYIGVFLYPLLSYFSYFGFFILAYIVCAIIILWIKDKKMPGRMIGALFTLAAGFVIFEYRLFHHMLFSEEETIRTIIDNTEHTFSEIMHAFLESYATPVFHAQDSHSYFVLPVCLIGLVLINWGYLKKKEYKKIWVEPCNLVFAFISFNCFVCGIYQWNGLRDLIEFVIPQLTGFQFDRTVWFNPFLWFVLFFLIIKKLYDSGKEMHKWVANIAAVIAVCIVTIAPQTYNDFYATCYYHLYGFVKGTPAKDLNFREFFSTDLFEEIKQDMEYNGEWSVAYGMNPAILEYNGIATLDGYLGFHTMEYHNQFREIIEPAFPGNEWARQYYDEWGARAFLFSGSGESSYVPYRNLELEDTRLMINADALRGMDGKYIFSRIEISNADELGITLYKTYQNETSPYIIYVYDTGI